jgi:hypothetical protein
MVPAGGFAGIAAETLVKLVNNRKKYKRRSTLVPALSRDRKKPISGKPEIGAHFVSFNFTNNVILG